MIKLLLYSLPLLLLAAPLRAADKPPRPLLTGLTNLRAVTAGPGGKIYITVAGDPAKPGSGAVLVVQDGKAMPFVEGLNSPSGITAFGDAL